MRFFALIAGAALACGLVPSAHGQQGGAPQDVEQLFATVCGWCHNDGGRVAGHGPKLMDTTRSDDFIRERIMLGKPGAMPAFSGTFTDDQVNAIIAYIRALKPRQD
jgi:mono/diheme cytochrome c family protein